MNQADLESMSTDQLWALHEEIAARLAEALKAEKCVLENRLRSLQRGIEILPAARDGRSSAVRSTTRRPYPAVIPKYRNPERPSETWAGRGKTPRWLTEQLKSGRRIDDFRIRYAA